MVLNLVEFEMSLAEAVAAPRISFVEPQALAVERSLPAGIHRGLEAKGHQLRVVEALGNAHAVQLHYENGKLMHFEGSSDPRGEGSVQDLELDSVGRSANLEPTKIHENTHELHRSPALTLSLPHSYIKFTKLPIMSRCCDRSLHPPQRDACAGE